MHKSRALLLAGPIIALALAGCSTATSGSGITIGHTGDAYTFKADATADNYTWDLGDHLTVAYGKSVTHTYDFANGNISIVLKTRTATETKQYTQSLVLGTGVNQKPVFLMEGETDWAVVGEPVKFSASLSHDAENDPLRYSWSCLRTADAIRVAPHYHDAVPGTPFATAPAGSVTAGKANRTLPPADIVYPGDLCDALGSGTPPSTHAATIQGIFTNPAGGKYTIFLLASDPVHPTVSGSFNLIVTKRGERPSPLQPFHFSGKFQGGVGGATQQVCTQGSIGQCDAFDGSFSIPLNGVAGNATMAFDSGAVNGLPAANKVTWIVKRGDAEVAKGSGITPETKEFNPALLTIATYNVHVQLDQGRDAAWNLTVMVRLNMDPTNIY